MFSTSHFQSANLLYLDWCSLPRQINQQRSLSLSTYEYICSQVFVCTANYLQICFTFLRLPLITRFLLIKKKCRFRDSFRLLPILYRFTATVIDVFFTADTSYTKRSNAYFYLFAYLFV